MKKWLLCFFLCFCLSGCGVKEPQIEIHSQMTEETSYIEGISYPTTGYSKFDRKIRSYIESVKKEFIESYAVSTPEGKAELNIDYTYHIVNDCYFNLVLKVFINSPELAHPINSIQTFVFDFHRNRFLSFSDVIEKQTLKEKIGLIQTSFLENYKDCILLDSFREVVTPDLTHYSLFTFTDSDITIYFNPYEITAGYCNVVSGTFSFAKFPPKLTLTKDSFYQEQVTFSPITKVIDPTRKVVALTFDDGPSKYTKEILEVLEKNEAVATFFVLGNKIEPYQELLQKSLSLGNELGNHTYNHKSMSQLSVSELQKQIEDTQQLIFDCTGFTPRYFRPTYGSLTKRGKKSISLEIALWSIDTKDWKSNKSAQRISDETMQKVKDGSVILLHDTHAKTVEAVKQLVPKLREAGYQFVTLSELEELSMIRQGLDHFSS